jgi:hypothetical protein
MRTLLEYAGTFFLGFVAAALICVLVVSIVEVPGPGDHQAGFAMTMGFCVMPVLGMVLGCLNVFLYHRRRTRQQE